jgi:hypothetical protein
LVVATLAVAQGCEQLWEREVTTDNTEIYYAEMEAVRNEAEDAYFNARPPLDEEAHRDIFRAGFERGFQKLWNERAAQPPGADTADAARYRWLRGRVLGSEYRRLGFIYSEVSEIDAQIDRILACSGSTKRTCLDCGAPLPDHWSFSRCEKHLTALGEFSDER